MVEVTIASSLESVFGISLRHKGTWSNLEDFFSSIPEHDLSKIVDAKGNLFPYVRVVRNGKIVSQTSIKEIGFEASDKVDLFLAASGG